MSSCRSAIRTLLAGLLLLAPAAAPARLQVTLNQPAEALADGAEFQFQAVITGPGAGGGCHWAVAERGLRLEPWDGGALAEQDGGARFRAQGGAALRTLQVRATARRDPAAFAVVTVQVRPRAGAGGPAAETKAGAGDEPQPSGPALDPEAPRPPAWARAFARTGAATHRFSGIAWDPAAAAPAIFALENLGHRAQVVRLGLDGGETVISRDESGQLPLDEQTENLAVLPGGDLVVADSRNHRICRLTRDGQLTVLAGTGATEFDGDTDAEGRPRPAAQAALGWPAGIAVTADGAVVFADFYQHRIRRFVPGGPIETLAGDGGNGLQFSNDLTRRLPATACTLQYPHNLAAAPDGRIVFTMGGSPGIFILHPDGTLGRARQVRGAALVTVTEDNAIVAWDGHQWLYRLAGAARPEVLAETQLPLQALAPAPGGGLLVLDRYRPAVSSLDPPGAGRGLLERVNAAWAAVQAGDLGQAAAIRAALARWADAWPPSAEVVADHLLATRPGPRARLPRLPEELQAEPFEWLRGDYRGVGFRARVALHTLDRALEAQAAGTVAQLKALAAPAPAAP